ncbi:hypothetical protein EDB89DRAFT_2069173 [Lactarius sanguifluus]|nr:hypothetical protein EDB89DRAFT_2069173 [Lactarius sanguifluus]
MSDLQSSKHPMTLCPSLATRSKSRRTNYSCSLRILTTIGGKIDEALEIDVTGKITLASWHESRDTRIEVVQVREVVGSVLKDHSANDQELYHRAQGLLFLGAIFKSTVPGESDEDRRELEPVRASSPLSLSLSLSLVLTHRMVAAKPKKKQAPPSATAQAGAKTAHDVRHANGHTSPATDAKSPF